MFKSRSETPGRLQRKESTPPSILTTTTEEASPVASSSSSSSSPVGAATPTTSAPTTPTNAAQTVREDNNNISSSPQPNSDSDSDVPSPLRLRSGSGIIALPGLTPKNGDQIRPSLPFRKPSLRIQPATAAAAADTAAPATSAPASDNPLDQIVSDAPKLSQPTAGRPRRTKTVASTKPKAELPPEDESLAVESTTTTTTTTSSTSSTSSAKKFIVKNNNTTKRSFAEIKDELNQRKEQVANEAQIAIKSIKEKTGKRDKVKIDGFENSALELATCLVTNDDVLETTDETRKFRASMYQFLEDIKAEVYYTNCVDSLGLYSDTKKNLYDKLAKCKKIDEALIKLAAENLKLDGIKMPQSHAAEKEAFAASVSTTAPASYSALVQKCVDVVVDIWEVNKVIDFVQEQDIRGKLSKEDKKSLKTLTTLVKPMKHFLETLALRANSAVVFPAQERLAEVEQIFAELDKMLAQETPFEKDRVWYVGYLAKAFSDMDWIETLLNKGMNLALTQHINFYDDEILLALAKNIKQSDNIGKVLQELQALRKRMKAKYGKLGFDRGLFAAEYGLTELFQRVYDILSQHVLKENAPYGFEPNDAKLVKDLLAKKKLWDGKRADALQELKERDRALLQRIKEAADEMRPLYAKFSSSNTLAASNGLEDYDKIDFHDIVSRVQMDPKHMYRLVHFKGIPSTFPGTIFKAPKGDSRWDTVYSKNIRKEADWAKAIKVFLQLENKVLKKHGVPEIAHVWYGHCPTGTDELISYHEDRLFSTPIPIHLGAPNALESHTGATAGDTTTMPLNGDKDAPTVIHRSASDCLINGIGVITGTCWRTFYDNEGSRPTSYDAAQLVFNNNNNNNDNDNDNRNSVKQVRIKVNEVWPCVNVCFVALEEPLAVWVDGKCSLANVNFKDISPKA